MTDEIWILVHHDHGSKIWRCDRDRTMFNAIVDALSDTWRLGYKPTQVELLDGDYANFVMEASRFCLYRGDPVEGAEDAIMFNGPRGPVTVRLLQ